MKFRKKHSTESEVFTDSLNDILFILLMFFLIVSTIANPNIIPLHNPKSTAEAKAKQNIMVSIDKDQNFYLGTTRMDIATFDSSLSLEIKKHRALVDSPTVVINADTSAHYGNVFHVMGIARKDSARVMALIKKEKQQ